MNAAGEVLMERGFAAVSHRTVADRAGLPVSATTYYFASLEALVAETVAELGEQWLTRARAFADRLPVQIHDPAQLALALIGVATPQEVGPDRSSALLALYGRYLEAARRPDLRPLVVGYDDRMDALLGEVLDRGAVAGTAAAARLVLAVIDGATLRALAEGAPTTTVASAVEALVRSWSVEREPGPDTTV